VGDKLTKEYILITSSNFPAGGAGANYLNLFCKGLKAANCNVSVLLLKGFSFGDFESKHRRHNITKEGVPFSYLGFIKRPKNAFLKVIDEFVISLKLIFRFFSFLANRKKIKILLYNSELHSNIIIFSLAQIFSIKIITFVPEFYDKNVFNGSLLRKVKWYGFLFNFSFLNTQSYKLIVFSHYLKNQYLVRGYKESNIIVQPNLTDFDFWKADNSILKYHLGYSGTPTKENGLFDLFEAISILKKDGINTSLIVVGDNPYGDSFIPELEILCKNLDINDNVSFKGLVELHDVKVLLSECEILTLTRPRLFKQKRASQLN
jgi:glycosyltransferase involved in cell wall biosynthesis